jgi:hypothetical protein
MKIALLRSFACVFALTACGPFTSQEEAALAAGSGGDGGTGALPDNPVTAPPNAPPSSSPDGGSTASADAGTTPAPQDLLAHDLHVTGLVASIVYAHKVTARDIRAGKVVVITDKELPKPGTKDIHDDVVSAAEAHVHDVDADWLDADILYVETIASK